RRFGLDARLRRKEVAGPQGVELLLEAPLEARELGHGEAAQRPVLALPALAQLRVLLRAIEQLSVGSVVVGGIRDHGHQPRAAAFALALVGELAQRLAATRSRRQEVGAVAERDATERLEGTPDAHAPRRARRRKRDDEKQPIRTGAGFHVLNHTLMKSTRHKACPTR